MGRGAVVGRERELASVRAFLDGGTGVLVLEGQAGIGKTTVWQAGVDAARASGVRVLVARPAETETAFPYATLSDLLEPVRDDALRSMPAAQRRALDVALVRQEPEASADARAVAAAALTGLRTLAEDGAVLVAVDDAQWVDDASAEVLSYAVRRLVGRGVSMLATERFGADGGLRIAEVDRLKIRELGPNEIARIVRDSLGLDAHRSALLRLAERSGGNPFFALELARDGRLLEDPDAPLPPSLDALLHERVAAVPRAVRDALLVAAAHRAPTPELLALAGVSPRGLEGALELGLLVQSEGRVRFSHPLLASAVLARITPARRRGIHARLAAALEDPDERALHLARATRDPRETVAASLDEAVERIRRRGATRDAAELAAHAVRLTPPEHADAARRRAVAHAVLVGASGDAAQACAMLQRLADDAPEGPERARVLLSLAGFSSYDVIRICEEALEQADPPARPKAMLALSGARWGVGDFTEAARLIDEAVPLAEASGDRESLAFALFNRGWMQWSRGQGIPEELLMRANALVPPTELRPILDSHPERTLATILVTAAEYERARPLLEKHLRLARDHGDDAIVSALLAELGYLEARVGHASRGEELVEAAVELAGQVREPTAIGWTQYWRARVYSLLGRLDAARADAEETIAKGFELYRLLAVDVLGYVALTLGQLDTAADELQHVLDRMRDYPWCEPSPVDAHQHLAEVYVLRGELERAEAVLDELETVARPLDRTRSIAGALRVRGLIAAHRSDIEGAEALLRESLRIQAERPEPHESGRTLLHLGAMLRKANRKRPARDALQEAVSLLDGCGSRVWADRARAELDRIGGRALRTGAMTATEEQIARLVSSGKSNHEVAHALSLSPKTVEWNLSKIYRKLGVRSRTELASKLARRQAV